MEHASGKEDLDTGTASNAISSDSDSDYEADELVAKYISVQTRIHLLRPDLTQMEARRNRRSKKPPGHANQVRKETSSEVGRLLRKLDRIESDVLFDQDEAYRQWTEVRITLVKEAAERRKFYLDEDSTLANEAEARTSTADLDGHELSEGEDRSMILGDLFSSLPDTRIDVATGVTTMVDETSKGVAVIIRDFGKWNGVSPRRTFEEACKAR